jgi:hypothetical protein
VSDLKWFLMGEPRVIGDSPLLMVGLALIIIAWLILMIGDNG